MNETQYSRSGMRVWKASNCWIVSHLRAELEKATLINSYAKLGTSVIKYWLIVERKAPACFNLKQERPPFWGSLSIGGGYRSRTDDPLHAMQVL